MSSFARTRDYPEALIKILFKVIDRTPYGGATLDELLEAYRDARDRVPHRKTIQRAVKRINQLFDPLAYCAEAEEGHHLPAPPRAIEQVRDRGRIRYRFTRDLQERQIDPSLAFLMALSLYPQQRGLLGSQFEVVMKLVFEEVLGRLANVCDLYNDIRKYIYVTGPEPLAPQKSFNTIKKVLQAIRQQKRLKIDYCRTYDGELTVREVEPYGIICRFNNWYLTGRCTDKNQRRIFLLSQIRRITLVENSTCRIPDGFSLHDDYCHNWGIWTEEEAAPPQPVILWVGKGPAERFRTYRFHDSQKIRELPGGSLEVSFLVSGMREMLPWLMSWGDAIRVLAPEELRQALCEQLERALGVYRP